MTGRSALSVLQQLHRLAREQQAGKLSDRECLERFRTQRDEEAFAVLVRRHGPMVRGVCRRVLRHAEDAEDVFQATFLVLARKAGSIRWKRSIAPWLYQVAYRLAHKGRVQAARRREQQATMEPAAKAVDESWREVCGVLDEELHNLTEKYRSPLVLCYLEGQTRDEAAERLGWSLGTLKRRLQKGRELLRLRLMHRGVTLPAVLLSAGLTGSEAEAALSSLAVRSLAQAATAFASGGAGPHLPAIPLAESAPGMMSDSAVKLTAVLLLTLSLAAGAGLWTCRMLLTEPPQAQPASLPEAARDDGERQAAKDERPRTDRYGDPLPPGAMARLGTVRFRHPFWVSGLAFTPDGKTLASACRDGSVHLWDAATGKETCCFRCPPNTRPDQGPTEFLGVALSPDGKTLLALGNGKITYVWDRATGKELHGFTGQANGFSLALSPNGKTVAIGDGRGKVQLWDLKTGKPIHEFGAKGRPLSALAFSPDSKTLACGSSTAVGSARAEDGVSTIHLWDAEAGRQLRELKGHTGGVTALAFSHDGRMLVSVSHDATLRFWEPATGKQVRQIQVPDDTTPNEYLPNQKKGINYGGVLTVAYSPDGRLLASGSFDGTARIWDSDSGMELHALRGHGREVASVVFSPDGKVLVSGSRDHTIRLWDAKSGEQLQPRQGHEGPVNNLAVSLDGRLAAAACGDNTVRLWELATQRQLHVLRGHTGLVYGIAFSPDGRTVATGSADRTVHLWETATGREIHLLRKQQGAIYSIAFTPVRNMLLWGEANGTLHFWDRTTGKELQQLPEIYSGKSFQLSSDGKILATAARDAVHLLDVKTGKELRRFAGDWPHIGISPDGQTLALQRSRDKIRLWNTATGDEMCVLADEDSPPGYIGASSYVFSPDGRVLARVGKGDLELWEVLTGKLRRRFGRHQIGHGPFAFSPDGKTLLSGSNDTTILIWDVARQQEGRLDRLSETELQRLWRDLAGDAGQADRAIWQLAAAPEEAVPYLEEHVHPIAAVAPERLTRLVADLDSDQFTVRDKAMHELEELGELAGAALRKALAAKPSLETRRRIEELLAKLRGPLPAGERLRSLRAVEVLEHAGTEPARRVLTRLASGAPEGRLTREAKGALQRLTAAGRPR